MTQLPIANSCREADENFSKMTEASRYAVPSAKTYDAAFAQLPADAEWSCSFGYPGKGGYCEYYRDGSQRYIIENGKHDDVAPFVWTIRVI